jgi:hypothetical protein
LRVAYTLPGEYTWAEPEIPARPPLQPAFPSRARARTREAALAAARQLDPRADPGRIVPTELDLVFLYTLGENWRRGASFR